MFLSVRNGLAMARKKYSKVLQFAWIRNTCKLLRKMEASKTVKKKDIVLSSIYLQSRPLHLKQKKMNSRTLQKSEETHSFFPKWNPCLCHQKTWRPCLYRSLQSGIRNMRNGGHSVKTEKHWKHRKAHCKHPKCHQKHRKHIGKASERHRKGIGKEVVTPQNAFVLTSRDDPGIGKASENIWKYWKAWGNIGKHRKTSDPTWKNLNKDGNSRSLSDSLICSTKQPHWRHLEIAVFSILIPCLFAQQSRLIGCSWQTSPPKENCSHCLVHWRHMRLSIISLIWGCQLFHSGCLDSKIK